MTKNKLPVRFTGQHFTIDKVLIADAIKNAEINKNDVVLDIGAGKGFITVHLARKCKTIIAIENDGTLISVLRKKFSNNSRIIIVNKDFRKFTIPEIPFKIVSNIPFSITSEILKSLMFENMKNFMGGSLVMQLEPVQKLFFKNVFNPYTVFYHTFFDLKLLYEIAPDSFMPPPKVKSALLKIERKERMMNLELKEKYLIFLTRLLQNPHLTARTALKKVFRKSQVREITERYGINSHHKIVSVSAHQWQCFFLEMLDRVPEKYHPF